MHSPLLRPWEAAELQEQMAMHTGMTVQTARYKQEATSIALIRHWRFGISFLQQFVLLSNINQASHTLGELTQQNNWPFCTPLFLCF